MAAAGKSDRQTGGRREGREGGRGCPLLDHCPLLAVPSPLPPSPYFDFIPRPLGYIPEPWVVHIARRQFFVARQQFSSPGNNSRRPSTIFLTFCPSPALFISPRFLAQGVVSLLRRQRRRPIDKPPAAAPLERGASLLAAIFVCLFGASVSPYVLHSIPPHVSHLTHTCNHFPSYWEKHDLLFATRAARRIKRRGGRASAGAFAHTRKQNI